MQWLRHSLRFKFANCQAEYSTATDTGKKQPPTGDGCLDDVGRYAEFRVTANIYKTRTGNKNTRPNS